MLEKSEKKGELQETKEGRRGYCVKSRQKRCRMQDHRRPSSLSSASLREVFIFLNVSSGNCSHAACASSGMMTQRHIKMEMFGL